MYIHGDFGNRPNERILREEEAEQQQKFQPNQTVKGNKIKVYLATIYRMTYEK